MQSIQDAQQLRGHRALQASRQATDELVRLAEGEPDHPWAGLALEKAATTMQRLHRPAAALVLYERILERYDRPEARRNAHNNRIVTFALFQRAFLTARMFDYELAARRYDELIDRSPELVSSDEPAARRYVEDALLHSAMLYEDLHRWNGAARRYRAYAGMVGESDRHRSRALFRAASMELRAGRHARANRAMRRWVTQEIDDAEPGLVAEAWVRLAESWVALGRERQERQALERVLELADEHPDDVEVARWGAAARTRLEPTSPPRLESFAAGRHLEVRNATPTLDPADRRQ